MKQIGNRHKIQIVMIVLFSFLLVACGKSGQTNRESEVYQKDEIEEYPEAKSESEQEQEPVSKLSLLDNVWRYI